MILSIVMISVDHIILSPPQELVQIISRLSFLLLVWTAQNRLLVCLPRCDGRCCNITMVTVVVNGAENCLISWDELSKWQDKCTQTTRTLLLTPDKKEVCHLPEMTSNVGPLISFDPGLQEEGCFVLLGIGIRAELSRSCRKQQDHGSYWQGFHH